MADPAQCQATWFLSPQSGALAEPGERRMRISHTLGWIHREIRSARMIEISALDANQDGGRFDVDYLQESYQQM